MFGLDKDQIAFIESGVSIMVASRDPHNRPFEGRSAGCRVAPDGSAVTVFLSRLKYPLLLDAIRRSGVLAVSFSEPSSNRSLQLKSTTAEMVELRDGDAQSVAFQHIGILSLEFHVDKLSRPLL